ncbi:MAG: hypothetical protein AMXMBFR61_19610 [Fimbriimonadales bacterium]
MPILVEDLVMLSLSKHDPDHRPLPTSDTTIAASAVMLRQAQHDGAGAEGRSVDDPVAAEAQHDGAGAEGRSVDVPVAAHPQHDGAGAEGRSVDDPMAAQAQRDGAGAEGRSLTPQAQHDDKLSITSGSA